MATIRRRGAHQYQARIRSKGGPFEERTFRTRAEAEAWLRTAAETSRARRTLRDPPCPTLEAALLRYAQEVTPHKKSARQEMGRIARWRRVPLAAQPLDAIVPSDLAAWRDLRAAAGTGANTIRLDLAVLSHLYEVARKDWGFTELMNPTRVIRKPKAPRGRDRRLAAHEADSLLSHCAATGTQWLAGAIALAIETAMRRGELLALRWSDINLDRRIARLHDTKNGEARSVPLSTTAVGVLERLPRHPSGRVIPLHPDSITWGFHKACAACGIAGLRFHDLRHEATSRLFERGFNMMEVSTVTGHKSLQMLKRYTHLRAEDLVQRLG